MMKIAGCALLISAFIVLTVAEPFSPQDVDAELYSEVDVENEGRLVRSFPSRGQRPVPSPTFPRPPGGMRLKRDIRPGPNSGRTFPRPSPTFPRPPSSGRFSRSLPVRGGPFQRPTPSPTFPRPPVDFRRVRSIYPQSSLHVPLVYRPNPTVPQLPKQYNGRYRRQTVRFVNRPPAPRRPVYNYGRTARLN